MILQLQFLSKSTFDNLGGLYVQASEIACVESVMKTDFNRILITLKNGKEYLIPWRMTEFLDEWCRVLSGKPQIS